MVEYPAMVYKHRGNKTFMANCIVKNLIGFGKTEEEAVKNLKTSLQNSTQNNDITIKPMYSWLMS